ncbi:MAG: hypothetical protein U5K00_00450 [Melioribacteraceae bacterium]|nr:hypothetical protein [Melioribacteraceae bacterium]
MFQSKRKFNRSNNAADKVSIQLRHVADGRILNVPMYSYSSRKDTVITAHDYWPVVQSLFDVEKPSRIFSAG